MNTWLIEHSEDIGNIIILTIYVIGKLFPWLLGVFAIAAAYICIRYRVGNKEDK